MFDNTKFGALTNYNYNFQFLFNWWIFPQITPG